MDRSTSSTGLMESATVRAYDSSGNRRVPTPIKVGDLIDWKKQGTPGAYRCRVLGLKKDDRAELRIRVQVLSHDGAPVHAQRYITDRHILRVYREAA